MHDSSLTTGQKGPRLYLTRDNCPTRLYKLSSTISHIRAEGYECGLELKHGSGTSQKLWMNGGLIDRQMAVCCLRSLKTSTEVRVNGEVEQREGSRIEMTETVY